MEINPAINNYRLAGWWRRAVAWAIDLVTVIVFLTPLYSLIWGFILVGPFNSEAGSQKTFSGFSEECLNQTIQSFNCGSYQASGKQILLIGLVSLFLTLLVIALYYGSTMKRAGRRNGQSWGKQLLGIRVIHEDNSAVDFVSACYRQVLIIYLLVNGLFSIFSLGIFWFINYLYPLYDKNNQALHDKIAHTRVVRSE